MHCHSCGKVIEQDSRFCRYCGALQPPRAEDSDAESVGDTPLEVAAPSAPAGDSISPLWPIAGAALLLVIVALALARPASAPSAGRIVENVETANYAMDDALMGNDVTALDNASGGEPGPALAPEKPEGPWSYRTSEDKVRGGTSYLASATSTNSVDLDPPYEGGSTLEMTVRRSPAYGLDVLFILSSGQLLCHAYDGCYATVRFDNAPPERIELNEPSDNSSDTVFVAAPAPFVAKLRKARHVVVEIEIYEAGRPQFEFDVHGLKWDH